MTAQIRKVQFARPRVCETSVEMLEQWLARAKAGEVQAIAVAGVKICGAVSTEWVECPAGCFHELNSAVAILHHRLLAAKVTD